MLSSVIIEIVIDRYKIKHMTILHLIYYFQISHSLCLNTLHSFIIVSYSHKEKYMEMVTTLSVKILVAV